MPIVSSSPPRAPPIKYSAPLGTRWAKETAAAGGVGAFDLPTDPKNIGPWILGECVGKGASGRVKIAKHRLTGELAAVKILPVAPLVSSRASLATQQAKTDKQRLGIDREITMMKLMNHPNIMRIYDVFEGEKELFLVLEYVEGGELFDFLVNRGRLPPAEALAFFKQIVYGLNYAHTFSIIHRDLKPENILLASISPPLIKIADWGMAAFAHPSLQLETSCGSPHYASPEIVNGQTYQGNATDVWSCGVILYALLTGRLPFDDKNVRTLLGKVKSGKYDMPSWIDPLAKDLLGRMLVVDVSRRISVPEILSHPWLQVPSASPPTPEQAAAELAITQLPPSPSTLARPITSPSQIDPELLSSLRVIWGRHTDPNGDSIKRDLCSPAGQGVHAKAFYFLLGKYREDSMRNNHDRKDDNLEMKLDIGSMKFNLGWELDLSTVNKKYDGNRNSMLAIESPLVTRARSPASVPLSGLGPPAMNRTGTGSSHSSRSSSSRERAPSPAGPRAPLPNVTGRAGMDLWRAQANVLDDRKLKSSVNSPQATTSSGIGRGGPRPQPPRRGYTYMQPDRNVSSVQFPGVHLQAKDILDQQRPKSATGPIYNVNFNRQSIWLPSPNLSDSPVAAAAPPPVVPAPQIYAPVPVSLSKHTLDINTAVELDLHLSVGGGPSNPEPMVTMDDDKEDVISLVTTAISDTQDVPMLQQPVPQDNSRACRTQETEDKENQSVGEEGWSYVGGDDSQKGRGVGLGVGRDIGRNMGNVTNTRDGFPAAKVKKGKDKKSRPPTLDFRNLNQQKRSTVLGSPMLISPPVNATSTNRLLTSPVVGEFKGWFSNLFNWKHQSSAQGGILYSPDDVPRTRADVGRVLEGFGIIVEGGGFDRGMTPDDCAGALKCRVEEPSGSIRTASTLKSVRFRVEFSFAPSNPSNPTPDGAERPSSAMAGQPQSFNPDFLAAPAPNQGGFLSTPGSGFGFSGISPSSNSTTPRSSRNSILMIGSNSNNRGGYSPLSSPLPDAAAGEFPPGCASAILMVYEKGSVSSFRAVWRRLKEVYGAGGAMAAGCSPAMMSTPLVEHPDRFGV
ncbi:Serine/threonine-protein kinase GIN4 [Hypsizygus marmoreus]|uniref:Serine/threonine-protein kinase GIN4 n=1 Tax=Hypsizygus marmoreus TaxID=39966 RepID=A0A369K830_HYPMA|nr:Serine/threonine-protein kinase GIN4 [Hypsizygus marmoreus]